MSEPSQVMVKEPGKPMFAGKRIFLRQPTAQLTRARVLADPSDPDSLEEIVLVALPDGTVGWSKVDADGVPYGIGVERT